MVSCIKLVKYNNSKCKKIYIVTFIYNTGKSTGILGILRDGHRKVSMGSNLRLVLFFTMVPYIL